MSKQGLLVKRVDRIKKNHVEIELGKQTDQ